MTVIIASLTVITNIIIIITSILHKGITSDVVCISSMLNLADSSCKPTNINNMSLLERLYTSKKTLAKKSKINKISNLLIMAKKYKSIDMCH